MNNVVLQFKRETNRIKSYATIEELEAVINYMKSGG